jgi:hypothetical protein
MQAAKLRVVIGRASKTIDAESPDIQLENDKSVSRQHFAVIVDPELGTGCLEVLAKKGVAVNGVRSTPSDPKPTVATGDIIVAGKTTIIVTLKEGTKAAQAKKEVRCSGLGCSTICHLEYHYIHRACDIVNMSCFTAWPHIDHNRRRRRERRSRKDAASAAVVQVGTKSKECSRSSTRSLCSG